MNLGEIAAKIKEDFDAVMKSDTKGLGPIRALMEKVANGTATYAEAEEIAAKSGQEIARILGKYMKEVAPNGVITEEMTQALIPPAFRANYEYVTAVTSQIQKAVNTSAGIGLNAVVPEFNTDRVNGLIKFAEEAEDLETYIQRLGPLAENLSLSIVDEFAKANMEMQYNVGMSPKIKRILVGKACKWCRNLAGTYDYEDVKNTGNEVYRRHANCRCQILFVSEKKVQDVSSKRLYKTEKAATIEVTSKRLEEEERKRTRERLARNEILDRIKSGRYSLEIKHQKYLQHVEGTAQYKNAKKGRGIYPSKLAVSEAEVKELINRYCGTGVPAMSGKVVKDIEYVSADRVIGQYYDQIRNEWVDTKRMAIHYGKEGTHIVPVKGI